MYCEEVALQYIQPAPAAASPAGTTSGTSQPSDAGTPATDGGPTGSAEDLVVALRAALLGGELGTLATIAPDPAVVADRLLRSAEAVEPTAATGDDRVAEGRRIGADWARGRASLEELEDLAAVAGSDWNALTLPAEHSLVEVLEKHGVIPADQPGDVVLPRDPFVEGVVDGASEVHAEVRPLLRERLRRP